MKKQRRTTKKHEPTEEVREFIRRCITSGMTVEETAAALNMTDDTLRKYYRYEIHTSRAVLKGKAVKVIEAHLDDNSLDAAKFVLSRVAKWVEAREISGPGGGPIKTESKTNLYQLTDEELEAIARGDA